MHPINYADRAEGRLSKTKNYLPKQLHAGYFAEAGGQDRKLLLRVGDGLSAVEPQSESQERDSAAFELVRAGEES